MKKEVVQRAERVVTAKKEPIEFAVLRRKAGFTQASAAEFLGVSLRTIGRWENVPGACPKAVLLAMRMRVAAASK